MSKMYVILVLLLVNRIINAQNSSVERVIDLLPEKEKEALLEKVARRIFSAVQSKDDRDGVSGEVSDTELNEHDAFVNQILKEETTNLRKNGVKAGNNDNFNEKPDDETLYKKDVEEDAQLVDLTFRNNKRDKRNVDESKIVRINVDDVKKQDAEKDEDKSERSDREDIQIKHFPRASVTKKNLEKQESIDENHDNENDKSLSKETVKDIVKEVSVIEPKSLVDKENDKSVSKETIIGEGKEESANEPKPPGDKENDKSVSRETVIDEGKEGSLIEPKSPDIKDKDENIKDNEKSNEKESQIDVITDDNLDNSAKKVESQEPKEEINNRRLKENIDDTEGTSSKPEIDDINRNEKEEMLKIDVIASSTVSELTTPDVKPTVVLTEKLHSDDTTKINEIVSSKALLQLYNETNNSNNEKENIKKTTESTTEDTNIVIVSVAVIEDDSHKAHVNYKRNIESEKEVERNVGNENVTEENDIKHKTENNIEVTTLKTEVLTKTSLRSGVESSLRNKKSEIMRTKNRFKVSDGKNIIRVSENEKLNGEKDQPHKLDMKSFRFVNDMIKVIRDKIKPKLEQEKIRLYDASKQKNYEVYEFPADKKPFKEKYSTNINKENPYYVPIYNYSPNNAYYNPYNKFGPNDNDNKDDIVYRNIGNEIYSKKAVRDNDNSEERHEIVASDESIVTDELKPTEVEKNPILMNIIRGYIDSNQRKFKFGKHQKMMLKNVQTFKPRPTILVKHAKFTDIILNPNDYLDMEYSDRHEDSPYLRSRCELDNKSDSETDTEEKNPKRQNVNTFSDEEINTTNLKSHIQAVRQMLYKKKIFGHVPTNGSKFVDNDKPTLDSTFLRTVQIKDVDDNHIAMDYFFGKTRDESNHSYENKDIERDSDKYTETNQATINYDTNDEIKPATPHVETDLRSNKPRANLDVVSEILSIGDAANIIPTLDKLLNMTRSDDDLEPFLIVLEDMIVNDAKALKQYDWLGTTVDIQSALFKLISMADAVSDGTHLPDSDLELLKYTIYLHKSIKKIRKPSRKAKLLPRNRKKRRGIIKESGLINRHWLFRMMSQKYDTIITYQDFDDFNDFIDELQYFLYDFHTAVQEIADITKYNNQNWFKNLKELYLNTKRKHLLEVLLHVTAIRLFDLLENAAKNGVQDDFLTFVMNEGKYVNRTRDEMTFAQKIMNQLTMD